MSSLINTSNKTIAKNTFFLYLRMLLSILVSLYTSRVVLQTLGVDDFGIYGVVGGVVTMFSFLNASMSGASSRFITFALGKQDKNDVEETFSSSLIIHIGIALLIILFAETIGLWILENKLVVPEDRMHAARVVYQFSVLAMAVQVTQVPYNASIISYEKMDVYAYVELLNVFLKLGIVFILPLANLDKLILYSVLVFIVNLIIATIYRIYCIKKFEICRFKFIFIREKLLPMLTFSGWDLYGNMCYSARQQGVNILINMFFGVAYNAASSIATSIQGVVASLSSNVIQAFRPQIIKRYAQEDILSMQNLMQRSLKYTLLLYLCVAIPVYINLDIIMQLWLGNVPNYALEFCRVMLVITMFNLINSVISVAIHSTGNVKGISFISGTVYLVSVVLTYLVFKVYDEPLLAYYIACFTLSLIVCINIIIMHRLIPTIKISQIIKGGAEAFLYASLAFVPVQFFNFYGSPIFGLIFTTVIYVVSLIIVVLIFDKGIRKVLLDYLEKFSISNR